MGEDESGTLNALNLHRAELIHPTVAEHRGRIVKLMGDGALVEFPSVVDAVECAVAVQRGMEERNSDIPESKQITFRIGINLGDIIIDGDDIYGDGVNVAARLEGEADPGGICISGDAYRQVLGKIGITFEDMGERQLKNIAGPVQTYRWTEKNAAARKETASFQETSLSDKPSIAVLPFANMSGDPEQEPFADGMTDDMITDLSKISGLLVVASNTSFAYKGKPADVRDTARELGVRYILEGSVRKSGDRVRINAQLIDSTTGGHLWADRYDGELSDAFALQDEVGRQVVEALAVRLQHGEEARFQHVHTRSVEAYEQYVLAKSISMPPIKARLAQARDAFSRAIELDPEFAGGYAGVSVMLALGAYYGQWDEPNVEIDRAVEFARKGIEVDDTFGWSHTALGIAYLARHEFDAAVSAAEEGERRQPGDADALAYLGLCLIWVGRAREAIERINRALSLNTHVNVPYYYFLLLAHFTLGEYAEAVAAFEANIHRGGPTALPGNCAAAAAYAAAGELEKAERMARLVLEEMPDFTVSGWQRPYWWKEQVNNDRFLSALVEAGLPE
jgi:adenylate cyclase